MALEKEKDEKIYELKLEGLRRSNVVYGGNVFTEPEQILLLVDIDNTYTRSGAPAARLVSVNQILTAYQNARSDILALTSLVQINNYDVVTDPAWPA